MTDDTTVERNDERSRYEILVGGEVAGSLYFRDDGDGRVVLPHTVVYPDHKGEGLGSILASEALADLARRGDVVVPVCPFVSAYLKGHEVAGLDVEWPDDAESADAATPSEPA